MPTAPTLPPTPKPINIKVRTRGRVRRARIGAYPGPAAGDGPNPFTREATLEYEDTATAIATIESFVKARAGWQPFWFPFEPGATLTLVRCPGWRGPRRGEGQRRSLILTLVEDHSAGYTVATT